MSMVAVGALFTCLNGVLTMLWSTTTSTQDLLMTLGVNPNDLSILPPLPQPAQEASRQLHLRQQQTIQQQQPPPPPKQLEQSLSTTPIQQSTLPFGGREYGINPAYLRLLKEAQHNYQQRKDNNRLKKKPVQGIVIGPTEGKWETYTYRAIRNAQRIQHVLAMTNATNRIHVALMTSQEHYDILQLCTNHNVTTEQPPSIAQLQQWGVPKAAEKTFHDTCRMWNHGKLFNDVIVTQLDKPLRPNDKHTNVGQGSSTFWLKAMTAYRNAPYQITLFVDSDAMPCPGFEKLFSIATLTNVMNDDDGIHKHQNYWQLPLNRKADLAIGLEQYATDSNNPLWNPGHGQGLNGTDLLWHDYRTFVSRNTGAVLLNFQRPSTFVFTEFLPLVANYMYNHVATKDIPITNDQVPFKVALFIFQKLLGAQPTHASDAENEYNNHNNNNHHHPDQKKDFVEQLFPMHASCRSYAGKSFGGINGFDNGMFPLVPSKENISQFEHCHECHCTPCLIVHTVRFLFVCWDTQIMWPVPVFGWVGPIGCVCVCVCVNWLFFMCVP